MDSSTELALKGFSKEGTSRRPRARDPSLRPDPLHPIISSLTSELLLLPFTSLANWGSSFQARHNGILWSPSLILTPSIEYPLESPVHVPDPEWPIPPQSFPFPAPASVSRSCQLSLPYRTEDVPHFPEKSQSPGESDATVTSGGRGNLQIRGSRGRASSWGRGIRKDGARSRAWVEKLSRKVSWKSQKSRDPYLRFWPLGPDTAPSEAPPGGTRLLPWR